MAINDDELKKQRDVIAPPPVGATTSPQITPIPRTPNDQYVFSGGRMISVAPNGQEIARNFAATPAVTPAPVIPQDRPMTNSDIVNRALYTPPLPTQPPPVQPKIGLTPMQALNEQFANSKQWQTTMTNQIKERKMLGLDPTEYVAEEKPGLTAGTLPEIQVRRKTKEEKQADWNELNTMAMAGGSVGIGPDGKPQPMAIQPVEDLFDNKGALDSVYYETTPDKNNKQDYIQRKAYLEQAKPIRDKIVKAFISMPKPESKEDVNRMIQSLGVDPRFKQLAINTVTKILERSNPDLINSIRGDRLVEKANENVYVDFARQHGGYEGMPRKEVIEKIKKNPEAIAQIEREGKLYRLNNMTYKPELTPQTPEAKVQTNISVNEMNRRLTKEYNDRLAEAERGLVSTVDEKGEPILMSQEAVAKQKAEVEMTTDKAKRERTMEELALRTAERNDKALAMRETPEYKLIEKKNAFIEKQLAAQWNAIEDEYKMEYKAELAGDLPSGTAAANRTASYKDLSENPQYKFLPYPGEAPEAPTQQSFTPDQRAGKASGRVEMGQVPTEQGVQGQVQGQQAVPVSPQQVIDSFQKQLARPDLSPQTKAEIQKRITELQQQTSQTMPQDNVSAMNQMPEFSDADVLARIVGGGASKVAGGIATSLGEGTGVLPAYRYAKSSFGVAGDVMKWGANKAKAALKDIIEAERQKMIEEWKRQNQVQK